MKPEDIILAEDKENLHVKDFYGARGSISQDLQGEGMWGGGGGGGGGVCEGS